MKSKSIKLVSIIVLAVLFVPLYFSIVSAVNGTFEELWESNRVFMQTDPGKYPSTNTPTWINDINNIYLPGSSVVYILRYKDDWDGGKKKVNFVFSKTADKEFYLDDGWLRVNNRKGIYSVNYKGDNHNSWDTNEQSSYGISPTNEYTIEIYRGQTNIDDLSTIPVRELPYYMFYEDGDHNYWFQEFNQIPVFTLRGSKFFDSVNREFEMDWEGIGGAKTYKYNTDTNTWDLYDTYSNLYLSVPWGNYWFKIHRANFDLNIGNKTIFPPKYDKWDTQDPSVNNVLKLIEPAQPVRTIYDKLRIKVKYSSVSDYSLESKDISIYPGVNCDYINTDFKPTSNYVSKGKYEYLTEKIVTMDIYLNDPVLVWNNNKTTVQITAAVASKKDKFGNIVVPGHSNRIYVEIEKTDMIDDDGDGYDDLTGETGHWDTDKGIDRENELPVRSQYPNGIVGEIEFLGDTLLYWVKTPFTMFRNGLQYITDLVNQTFSWTNNYATFVSRMFSFLPGPVIDMIGLMFMVIIITTLIKVVRG